MIAGRGRTDGRAGGRTDVDGRTQPGTQPERTSRRRGRGKEERRSLVAAAASRQRTQSSCCLLSTLRSEIRNATAHALRSTALHSTALHSDALLILRRSLAALQNEILLMRTQLYRIAAEEGSQKGLRGANCSGTQNPSGSD